MTVDLTRHALDRLVDGLMTLDEPAYPSSLDSIVKTEQSTSSGSSKGPPSKKPALFDEVAIAVKQSAKKTSDIIHAYVAKTFTDLRHLYGKVSSGYSDMKSKAFSYFKLVWSKGTKTQMTFGKDMRFDPWRPIMKFKLSKILYRIYQQFNPKEKGGEYYFGNPFHFYRDYMFGAPVGEISPYLKVHRIKSLT